MRKLVFLSPVNHDGYIRAKHILSKIYKGDILKKYLRVRCLFFYFFKEKKGGNTKTYKSERLKDI